MNYLALAIDYDGTLAFDGTVDESTRLALQRARAAGVRLVMVTGRELPSLLDAFPRPDVFDRIVAENGALLYTPADRSVRPLAAAAPAALVALLKQRSVPISVGHCIIATVEPYEHQVLEAIHELGLEWHVIFNKGAVMALPSDVTKATGLASALGSIGISADRTIGIGDAENDQAFLRACGLAVAVANALPSVKSMADVVTSGARGAGTAEIIDRLLAGGLKQCRERANPLPPPASD